MDVAHLSEAERVQRAFHGIALGIQESLAWRDVNGDPEFRH
jgi:hypothetical protein